MEVTTTTTTKVTFKKQLLDTSIGQMKKEELKKRIAILDPNLKLKSNMKKDELTSVLKNLLARQVDTMNGQEVINELKYRDKYHNRSSWNKTELRAWLNHLRCVADGTDNIMYKNPNEVVSREEFEAMRLFEIHMRYGDQYGFNLKLNQTKRAEMYNQLEKVWRANKENKEQDDLVAASPRDDVIRELNVYCAHKDRSSWSLKELTAYLDHLSLKDTNSVWEKDVNKAISREQFDALPLFRIHDLYGFSESETNKVMMYELLCKLWEDDEKQRNEMRMLVKPIVEAFLVQTGDDTFCVKQKAVSLKPVMNMLFLAELDESEHKSVCAFCRDNGLGVQTYQHRSLGKTVCVSRKDDEAHALAIIDRS